MAKALKSKRLYEFGPFRLDTAECLLRRAGEVVPLPPKPFDILRMLIENHGRLLDKDDLMQQVWPDTFVEEATLARNISDLRKVLGEMVGGLKYIETVPKRGYRFVAEVREVQDDADLIVREHAGLRFVVENESQAAAAAQDSANLWAGRRVVLVVAACAVVVGLAITAFWLSRQSRQPISEAAIQSIAVLPFKPLVADRRDESLELGMADTLITKLGSTGRIIVRPINAVRKYASLDQDPVAAGRELGVDVVLDGSMQWEGDKRIRVTWRLLRVSDGAAIRADRRDEQFSNIFTLQDTIAEEIAGALALQLTGDERKQLTKRYTDKPEAYQAYLKGRYFWNKRTVEGVKRGVEFFQQAIDLDPTYAPAHAGLADCFNALGSYVTDALPPKEVSPKAKAAAQKALQIDDTLGEAHASLAFTNLLYEWDWPGAEEGFKRAMALHPNYATAHHYYAHCLMYLGRTEEALAASQRALEIEPLDIVINGHLGWHYLYARQYDRAIEALRKTLEMDPNYVLGRWRLGLAYGQKGMFTEAITEFRRAATLTQRSSLTVALLGHAYAKAGRTSEARKALEELSELAKQRYVSPFNIAVIHAGLGEKEQAFAWLNKAYEGRDSWMNFLKVDPRLDSLRPDPRFADLMRRVGLPQ